MERVESTSNVSWYNTANVATLGVAVVMGEVGPRLYEWIPSWSALGIGGAVALSAVGIVRAVRNHVESKKEAQFQKIVHAYVQDLLAIIQQDDAESGIWGDFKVPMDLRSEPRNQHETAIYNGERLDVGTLGAKERQDLVFRLISRIKGTLTREDLFVGGPREATLRSILDFILKMPDVDQRKMVMQFGHVIGPWGDVVTELLGLHIQSKV
jgi:hypothetical protein